MSRKITEVDFYKDLPLPKPTICGLVNKVISPKGTRKLNENDLYEYHLKDELIQVYDGNPVKVTNGLYWAMSIYKNQAAELKWNHYLIIVDNGSVYPVAEFLDCHDSSWIKDAMRYIKAYFAGEDLPEIDLTIYRVRPRKSSWKTSK